jgi:hypothetical protein
VAVIDEYAASAERRLVSEQRRGAGERERDTGVRMLCSLLIPYELAGNQPQEATVI